MSTTQSTNQSPDTQTASPDMLATQTYMIRHKATADNFDEARRGLYKLDIKTFATADRMIFSAQHTSKSNLDNLYAQECNGLILELGTWKPLMIPPRSMRFNINTKESNKFLHQGLYNIYKAEDGTCVNMYFYNDVWCISTANGYQMNDVKWDGHSYQELLTDCLTNSNLTWSEFLAGLDKTCCYSFGFRHKDFHRFNPENRLWFIQSVNLDETSERYMWSSDTSPFENIMCQEPYRSNVSSLKDLYKLATTALEDYIENNLDVCHGFILRSNSLEITGQHSDLFIESSLMRFIRTMWYDRKMNNDCTNNNWDKEDRVTLSAYLDNDHYENFTQLFPQYSDRFNYYSKLVGMVINQMVNIHDGTDNTEVNLPDIPKNFTAPTSDAINYAAGNLLSSFKSNIKYSITDKSTEQKKRVFSEYVFHPCNLDLLMSLIVHSFNEQE